MRTRTGSMCFSVLQRPRCRIQALMKGYPYLQSTSFGSFWSGSFYTSRSTLGSGFKSKLLGSSFEPCRERVNRTWMLRPTRIERRTGYTQSSNPSTNGHEFLDGIVTASTKLNISKSALSSSQSIQYCDAQQKIQESQNLKPFVQVFVIDIETNGISRKTGRIIEIAVRDLLGGKNSCFQTLVNPEQDVLNSHIHGITTCMVNQPYVPRMEDLIPILMQYVKSRQIPGGLLMFVAHNGRCFDVPFLKKEFSRCSMEIPPDWLFLDTLPLARKLTRLDARSKFPSRISLQALCEYYGIPLVGSNHRAMSDVNSLSLVLERMTFDLKLTITDLLEETFKASDPTKIKKNMKKKNRS